MKSFDRYNKFKINGLFKIVPFIEIPIRGTDKYITFSQGKTNLDKISYDFYKNPDYAWLIMQANPEYGSIENFIPDGVKIRVPYPLEDVLNGYEKEITRYREING